MKYAATLAGIAWTGSMVLALSGLAHAAPISSGTYVGAPGGSNEDYGSFGGSGYVYSSGTVEGDNNVVTGGTFVGGMGGTPFFPGQPNFGGDGGPGLEVTNSGTSALIKGGTFSGGIGGLQGIGAGAGGANGDGGDAIGVYNLGHLTIEGGTFTPGAGRANGVSFGVFGAFLTLVGEFENTTQIGDGANPFSGTITGRLQNNSSVETYTYFTQGGIINFVSIPEPTSAAIMSLGGIALLSRRRR